MTAPLSCTGGMPCAEGGPLCPWCAAADVEPPTADRRHAPVEQDEPCPACGWMPGQHNEEDTATCAEVLREIAESEAEEIATYGHVRRVEPRP